MHLHLPKSLLWARQNSCSVWASFPRPTQSNASPLKSEGDFYPLPRSQSLTNCYFCVFWFLLCSKDDRDVFSPCWCTGQHLIYFFFFFHFTSFLFLPDVMHPPKYFWECRIQALLEIPLPQAKLFPAYLNPDPGGQGKPGQVFFFFLTHTHTHKALKNFWQQKKIMK